jgi:Ca2+-binding EF-hand superfamily protein
MPNQTYLPCGVLILVVLMSGLTSAAEHADLFQRLDANRDGQVVSTEVAKTEWPFFKRLLRKADTDDDGRLSLTEFQAGLVSTRPQKPITEKADNKLPGSDSLLLMLVWMDVDANQTITRSEVPADLQPLFDKFVELLKTSDSSSFRVQQLRQQAIRYVGAANRFVAREGIDAEVELALLNDKQWAYIERLQSSLRPGNMMENPAASALLFAELDTNGDGNVTAAEVPEPFAERFGQLMKRADRNQDKQLSEQEFTAAGKRLAKFAGNRPAEAATNLQVQELLARADRNGDGLLSRQEAPPRMTQRFPRLDQNGDGQLDHNELARAVENIAALRNSAAKRPPATPVSGERTKKPPKK